MTLQIFDNGGESLDRYTIFKSREKGRWDRNGFRIFNAIAASKTGAGFYLHIEAAKGTHLGRKVKFQDLDLELRNKLLNEFK